ncbi:MAG: universal stress protein [Alphaproteobacteria bacterium]
MNEGRSERPARANRVLLCVLDDTEELSVALDYASMRSRRTGARVGLLSVLEQSDDFQHWAAVGDLMREEARAEAERRLLQAAERVKRLSGLTPVLYVREGEREEQVVEQIQEDGDIAFLILAAATDGQGPGPLITQITGRAIGWLHIPVVIVPGNMSDEEIRSFA